MSAAVSQAKSDSESSQRALLQRLFPEVKVKAEGPGRDLQAWMQEFAKASQEVTRYIGTKKNRTSNSGAIS